MSDMRHPYPRQLRAEIALWLAGVWSGVAAALEEAMDRLCGAGSGGSHRGSHVPDTRWIPPAAHSRHPPTMPARRRSMWGALHSDPGWRVIVTFVTMAGKRWPLPAELPDVGVQDLTLHPKLKGERTEAIGAGRRDRGSCSLPDGLTMGALSCGLRVGLVENSGELRLHVKARR